MRILLISSRFHPFSGGVESVTLNLAREFSRKHEVLVISSKMGIARAAAENFQGIRIRRLWLGLPRSPRGFLVFPLRFLNSSWKLWKIARNFRPEVINYHFPDDASIYVYLLQKITHTPLILDVHGNDLQVFGKLPWYRFFLRRIGRSARWVVVHSTYLKRELQKEIPEVEAKIRIIPNGVGEEFFALSGQDTGNQNYFLYYGRLVPKKGVDVLIRAFDLVKEQTAADLIIVGDGEERENLEGLVKKLNLELRVKFVGVKTGGNLLRLIKGAQLAIIPSRREPFGIVALELMAAGKPIIAAQTGGLQELLEDKHTALFFESENYRDLAEKIVKLQNDPALRRRLAKNSTKEAQNYHWTTIGEKYLKLCDE